jgi:hypothetical protein
MAQPLTEWIVRDAVESGLRTCKTLQDARKIKRTSNDFKAFAPTLVTKGDGYRRFAQLYQAPK